MTFDQKTFMQMKTLLEECLSEIISADHEMMLQGGASNEELARPYVAEDLVGRICKILDKPIPETTRGF